MNQSIANRLCDRCSKTTLVVNGCQMLDKLEVMLHPADLFGDSGQSYSLIFQRPSAHTVVVPAEHGCLAASECGAGQELP